MFSNDERDKHLPLLDPLNWEFLDIGQKGIVKGKSFANKKGNTLLSVQYPGFVLVNIEMEKPLPFDLPNARDLTVEVVRTKEGLQAINITLDEEPSSNSIWNPTRH